MELAGKVALVTGAARRVGRSIALELARRGASIALHHHRSIAEAGETAAEIRALGADVATFAADLSLPAESEILAQDVLRRFGTVEILVNSAAIFYRNRLGSVTVEDWDRLYALNLRAPYLLTQALAPTLRERRGRVVMIADVAGIEPWANYVPYGATKAGIVYLTRGLAKELAPQVLVNAVAPGTVLPPEDATPEEIEREKKRAALGRIGTPEDVARGVAFLCESDYITGQVLAVDGGKLLG